MRHRVVICAALAASTRNPPSDTAMRSPVRMPGGATPTTSPVAAPVIAIAARASRRPQGPTPARTTATGRRRSSDGMITLCVVPPPHG